MAVFGNPVSSPSILFRGKGAFNAPAEVMYSCSNPLVWNIDFSSPLRNGLASTVKLVKDIPTCVIGLFFRRCPSAIRWLIISICIYSIKRVFSARPFPHIGKKCFKAIVPFGANLNSAQSIHVKVAVVRVAASPFHSLPANILWRASHSVATTPFDKLFNSKATTRQSGSSSDVLTKYGSHISAVTNAFPKMTCAPGLAFKFVGVFNNGQTTKTLTSKVYKFCHSFLVKAARDVSVWQASRVKPFGSYPSQTADNITATLEIK